MINQTLKLSDNNHIRFTKYLTLICGVYCFFFILPSILLKKTVELPYFGIIPISILFTGTYFVILDVIAEVYGYFEAKKALYASLISYTFFVFIMEMVVNINQDFPDKIRIMDNNAYELIFDNIYVTWIAVVICTLVFDILNIRLMTKFKFLFKGKYFLLRSVCSSSFAIVLFSFVTNLFAFYQQIKGGHLSFYFSITTVSIIAKILSLLIFAYPAFLLCRYLKNLNSLILRRI